MIVRMSDFAFNVAIFVLAQFYVELAASFHLPKREILVFYKLIP